jgi:hypothetical protein
MTAAKQGERERLMFAFNGFSLYSWASNSTARSLPDRLLVPSSRVPVSHSRRVASNLDRDLNPRRASMPKKFRDELFSLTPMPPRRYPNSMVNTTAPHTVACSLQKPLQHRVPSLKNFNIEQNEPTSDQFALDFPRGEALLHRFWAPLTPIGDKIELTVTITAREHDHHGG